MMLRREPATLLQLAPEYRGAPGVTLLDGGRLARIGGATMIGFCIGAVLVMMRRPLHPQKMDLLYIRRCTGHPSSNCEIASPSGGGCGWRIDFF